MQPRRFRDSNLLAAISKCFRVGLAPNWRSEMLLLLSTMVERLPYSERSTLPSIAFSINSILERACFSLGKTTEVRVEFFLEAMEIRELARERSNLEILHSLSSKEVIFFHR